MCHYVLCVRHICMYACAIGLLGMICALKFRHCFEHILLLPFASSYWIVVEAALMMRVHGCGACKKAQQARQLLTRGSELESGLHDIVPARCGSDGSILLKCG